MFYAHYLMNARPHLALSLGFFLVVSTFAFYSNANAQVNLKSTGIPTVLAIDDVPAKVRIGEELTLTGTLTTADGKAVSKVKVTVYLLTPEPQLIPLASGLTDSEGRFEVAWKVHTIATNRPDNDVTKKLPSQVFSLFAQFDGDATYSPSKSGKATLSIVPNMIKVFINSDKNAYKPGETALLFINFIDADDNFVDPDSIQADFTYVNQSSTSESLKDSPHTPIGEQLEKKKTGSYTYVTSQLKEGHTQITVIPVKADYNIEPTTITIIVYRTPGAVGRF